MKRALWAVLALIVAALAVCAGAFYRGAEVSGEYLRPTLERALSAAFGLPTRVEGPLRVHTGLAATLSADALVVSDPSAGPEATLARGVRPTARIDLLALLRRSVSLQEVTAERLELALARDAGGRGNWTPLFAPSAGGEPSSYSFAGIARLRIGTVAGSYRREGLAPMPFEISAFEGELADAGPVALRGAAQLGAQTVVIDARTAPLSGLGAAGATVPLQGSVEWSGLTANFDGTFARDGSRLDAGVHATAADAGLPLRALGLAAREPGALDVQLRLVLTAAETTVRDLALRLGDSVASGEVGLSWGGSRPRLSASLTSGRIDLRPLLIDRLAEDKTGPEAFVALLERAATGIEADVKLSAQEIVGLVVEARAIAVEAHSGDLALDLKGSAVIAGIQVAPSLAYDARKPQRTLVMHLDSGSASTAALPAGTRPQGWMGRVAGLRASLSARGTDPRSIIASAQGELDARDLSWSFDRHAGAALSGRFDRLHVALQGDRGISVDAAGRLGGATCSLRASGAGLAPLLAGQAWPARATATCPSERVSANGKLTLSNGQLGMNLNFDAAAGRPGPIVKSLGVGATLPYPLSTRGTLALDEKSGQVKLAALQLGRTSGTGEAAWPRDAGGMPRVQLALATLNLDEFGATGDAPPQAGDLQREVLPANPRLPDLDFDIRARRVVLAGATLRQASFAGALRSQRLPPAKFRFDWGGMTVAGQFGADFSGKAPRIEIDAATRDADLRAVLEQIGRTDVGLRAAALSLRVRAQGLRLGELLAGATIDGTLDRGRLDLPADGAGGGTRIEFSAAVEAGPGKPTRLSATGSLGGEPVRLALDASPLAELARPGESLPLKLSAAAAGARLEASGKMALDGTGNGRAQIAGQQLARLGRLLRLPLPEAEPYSASGDLNLSDDAIRVTDLHLSFGRSRVSGQLQVGRATRGRPLHRAGLESPGLHLEDIGAARWLRLDDDAPSESSAEDQTVARRIERLLDVLRLADIDIDIDVASLHGAGVQVASGRLTAKAEAEVLQARLKDVHTAGGGIDAEIRVDAATAPPAIAVRAQVRDLEYGPMLRAADPATTMEGTFDFRADLAVKAPPAQMLRELNGSLDAAIYPRGLQPRALGLWGVGLVNGLLRQLDPDSPPAIDCAVAGFDVARGVARSDGFFVDATRVRIVGEVEIDLVMRALSGRIDPQSKAPQLLALAPTMLLGGTVDSPRVSAAPENIVTVPLRFATTLGGLVSDWRFGTGRASSGPAGCREAYELLQQADPAAN